MAVIDQDNFSNISWHSEQNDHAGPSSSTRDNMTSPEFSKTIPDTGRSSSDGRGGRDHSHHGDEVLECTVSDPHKENDGTKDAYVSYLITTNTTFSTFQRPVTTVRRRFTDFVFLYRVLCQEYQASAIPPLPDKQRMEYVRGDRFGPDFTARRAYSFQRFLSRLALHPDLRRAPIFHTFLESHDWNATMHARQARGSLAPPLEAGSPGPQAGGDGFLNTFTDSFMNAFTKTQKPDRRFVDTKEKADKLDEDLTHVEKVVARVVRREADLEMDHKDLAEQFQKLITLEPGVESAVHAFAASVEDTATGLKKLKDSTDQDYLGSLRDMVAYSGALKGLIKAREQKQLDYEQLIEYLNKATSERDSLTSGHSYVGPLGGAGGFIRSKIEDVRGVDHEQARRDRLRKLELRIDELTRAVENARTESENFGEQVGREVESFEYIKKIELKKQFGGFVDSHIDFYQSTIETWEKYVQEMEAEGAVQPAA
ncbi:intercellular trafficking and secretion [Podospora bellae-mahoneyi]|uniref:Sorting nexin-4 n=1 Tax=Podospora bellae-mahoneyi TaxID=2093777 RepID=A0ABR0FXD0_9PEZI|nr:intercellular trafficking and secretion [Podospora bellae-mahoneyi]